MHGPRAGHVVLHDESGESETDVDVWPQEPLQAAPEPPAAPPPVGPEPPAAPPPAGPEPPAAPPAVGPAALRFAVPGGFLRKSPTSIDAHCECLLHENPGNPCRLNRTFQSDDHKRGRPIGLLLSWLEYQGQCDSHRRHKDCVIKARQTQADNAWFTFERRQAWRKWVVDQGPDYRPLLQAEKGGFDPANPYDEPPLAL